MFYIIKCRLNFDLNINGLSQNLLKTFWDQELSNLFIYFYYLTLRNSCFYRLSVSLGLHFTDTVEKNMLTNLHKLRCWVKWIGVLCRRFWNLLVQMYHIFIEVIAVLFPIRITFCPVKMNDRISNINRV